MRKLFLFGAILAMAVSCTPEEKGDNYELQSIDKEEIKDDDI